MEKLKMKYIEWVLKIECGDFIFKGFLPYNKIEKAKKYCEELIESTVNKNYMSEKNWEGNWKNVKHALYLAHHEGMGNLVPRTIEFDMGLCSIQGFLRCIYKEYVWKESHSVSFSK